MNTHTHREKCQTTSTIEAVSFMSQCPLCPSVLQVEELLDLSQCVFITHHCLSVATGTVTFGWVKGRQQHTPSHNRGLTYLYNVHFQGHKQTHAHTPNESSHNCFSDRSASNTKLIPQMDFSVCVSTSELPVSWSDCWRERYWRLPFIPSLCVSETKRKTHDPSHTTV